VLTCLELSCTGTGLPINVHVPVLKDGIRRYIWREKKELTIGPAEIRSENGETSNNIHG
jgi:hypothetical protein